MKTMKTKLVLLTVLFCTIGLLSFYGPNFNVMRQPISTTGSNEYRFPINTPTPLTGLNSPSYRFVLYHGDGTFFIGTKDELLAHRHTYSTSASNNSQPYSPIMEVIARYDDGTIPPERSSSPQT